MDKETKQKYLQMLESNELYAKILSSVEKEDEKKKIKAFAGEVFLSLLEGFNVVVDTAKNHPEKMAEAEEKYISKNKG